MTTTFLSKAAAFERDARNRGFSDDGMTLVELLVSMSILLVVMGSFIGVYFGFSGSSTNTVSYSHEQGTARNVMLVLEADLRSADPLTLVPSSFTSAESLPPGTVTSSGTYGVSSTDVIAMHEDSDAYSPCPTTTTTTTTVPSPFLSSPFAANVVWAYDRADGVLTRYSYVTPDPNAASSTCQTGGWLAGMTLDHVTNAAGTMFTVSQNASVLRTQATTPSTPTVANEAAAACGTSARVVIMLQDRSVGQQFSFRIETTVPLPNETAVSGQACV